MESDTQLEPFRYSAYYSGSVRLASVEALLRPGTPTINIIEWRDLELEENPVLTID